MNIPGYRIEAELGKGGMATVYRGVQLAFERPVAIKVMLPALAADAEFSRRFLREAKLMAGLSHAHIVPVYDVGCHDGQHYLAMEYLPGGTLKQRMRDGLNEADSVRVIRDIASALDLAGEQDLIHRDVKPDNILFRADGSALLTDFGIARPSLDTEQMTRMGTVVGTPKYMSPEQHRGKQIDPRADLYSLGVIFYELLSGSPPFTADDPMALGIKHITAPVPPLPTANKRYQPLVKKLLAKDPDNRFQRGQELIAALDQLAKGEDERTAATVGTSTRPTTAAASSFQAAEQTARKLEPRLRTREQKQKLGLLASHYIFDIFLIADDFNQFQSRFESLCTELLNWHAARGKKCGGIKFKATIHPWIAGRVKESWRNLRRADSHAFLQQIPLDINLVGADNQPIEQYRLAPEN